MAGTHRGEQDGVVVGSEVGAVPEDAGHAARECQQHAMTLDARTVTGAGAGTGGLFW